MKELSIEEKAKAYDEALEKAKEINNERRAQSFDVMARVFPELKESEDERIRKAIRYAIGQSTHTDDTLINGVSSEEALAWLEKQSTPQVRTGLEWVNTIDDACDKRYAEEYAHGEYCHEQSFKWGFQEGVDWLEKQDEQKPAEWSEEDKVILNNIIWGVHMKSIKPLDEMDDRSKYKKYEDFLKSLPKRFSLHPRQELSEEDETVLNNLIYALANDRIGNDRDEYVSWLKSLKQRIGG